MLRFTYSVLNVLRNKITLGLSWVGEGGVESGKSGISGDIAWDPKLLELELDPEEAVEKELEPYQNLYWISS